MFELMAKLGEINLDELKTLAVRFVEATGNIRDKVVDIEKRLDKIEFAVSELASIKGIESGN